MNEQITGEVLIEDLSLTFFNNLPDISVTLNNVVIRDSLWYLHENDLLNVDEVHIALNPLSLLARKVKIEELTFENGTMYLFTNSAGYSNTSILKTKTNQKKKNEVLEHFRFVDMDFLFENRSRKKFFHFVVNDLKGRIKNNKAGWRMVLNTDIVVKECNFNIAKGSFLSNKHLEGKIELRYKSSNKQLVIGNQSIRIDKQPITWGGIFSFAQDPVTFHLDFSTPKILVSKAIEILPPYTAKRFKSLDVKDPVSLGVYIRGTFKHRDTPLVKVNYVVRKNFIKTSAGQFSNVSLSGYYINEVEKGRGHSDVNSGIFLRKVDAVWEKSRFHSDSVKVVNLQHPLIQCNLVSKMPLKNLNKVIGGRSFLMNEGNVYINVFYAGSLHKQDTMKPYWYGQMNIEKGSFVYMPRNLHFTNAKATILFRGDDLHMKNVQLQTMRSQISMSGIARNFLSLFYVSPDKVHIAWNISSPFVDLNEFRSFFNVKRYTSHYGKKVSTTPLATQLDKVLGASTAVLHVAVGRFKYRKFTAENVNALVALDATSIDLQAMNLAHANGFIKVRGRVVQAPNGSSFFAKARIDSVKVNELFYAFNNFGQKAIEDKNVQGRLSADVYVEGNMRSIGKVVPQSLKGTVTFDLQDGALMHLKPLEKINRYAFKKRNLSYITFKDLKSTLNFSNSKIYIHPMRIESSALQMDVSGVYGWEKWNRYSTGSAFKRSVKGRSQASSK